MNSLIVSRVMSGITVVTLFETAAKLSNKNYEIHYGQYQSNLECFYKLIKKTLLKNWY